MSTSAPASPTSQPSSGPAAPADTSGWGAVSIVLVGAFMALLDSTTSGFPSNLGTSAQLGGLGASVG